MERLKRFVSNANVQGCLSTGVVAIILLFGIIRDCRTGDVVFTVPVLAAAFGLPYVVRSVLIDNFSIVRMVMNAFAVCGIAMVMFIPKPVGPEPLWLRLTIIGLLGAYMGCYFWMLSDERVHVS
jgi:hypothetical protein